LSALREKLRLSIYLLLFISITPEDERIGEFEGANYHTACNVAVTDQSAYIPYRAFRGVECQMEREGRGEGWGDVWVGYIN
jgi:hypothetical protein